jgi:hypothetical protein
MTAFTRGSFTEIARGGRFGARPDRTVEADHHTTIMPPNGKGHGGANCAGIAHCGALGKTEVIEEYFCNFGLNPAYQSQFDAAGLRIVGTDADGETRILALAEHPFFVATLFMPQLISTAERPHPLIVAFAQAARDSHATSSPARPWRASEEHASAGSAW